MSEGYEVHNPDADATEKQIAGLRKFHARIPAGLRKGEASEWMDLLVKRSKFGPPIDDLVLSGPPSFHRASEKAPSVPPAQSPPPAPKTAPGPVLPPPVTNPMPSPEDWVTCESEKTVTDEASGEINRVLIKMSVHPAPGETFEQTRDRLLRLTSPGE
jgi:hypothetical protein